MTDCFVSSLWWLHNSVHLGKLIELTIDKKVSFMNANFKTLIWLKTNWADSFFPRVAVALEFIQ